MTDHPMRTYPPQHPEAARTAAAVEAFYTKPRAIEVAFFFDAPDSVIANVVRSMAASGRVVLDVRLMTAPLSVVTS